MKKIIALLMVFCLAFAFAACGGSSAPAPATQAPAAEAPAEEAPAADAPAEEAPADGLLPQPDGYKGTVTFIVASEAGSATDTAARAALEYVDLGEGINIVVENIPGGSQTIGITEMLNREADGYTMELMAPAGLLSQPVMNKNLTYTPDDIELLANLYPLVTTCVITAPDSELEDADDLYEFLTSGEPFQYGTANIGSFAHIALSRALMQVDNLAASEPVAYTGSANVLQSVINKEVPIALIDADFVVNAVKNGDVRALMILNDTPYDLLPDIPCAADYGFKDLSSIVGFKWLGMKKGCPEDIMNYVAQQFSIGLANPDFQAYCDSIGAGTMEIMTREEVAEMASASFEIYHDVLVASGYVE